MKVPEVRRYSMEGRAESLDEFSLSDEEMIENEKAGVEVRGEFQKG